MFAKRQTNKSNTELKCILIIENKIKKVKEYKILKCINFKQIKMLIKLKYAAKWIDKRLHRNKCFIKEKKLFHLEGG